MKTSIILNDSLRSRWWSGYKSINEVQLYILFSSKMVLCKYFCIGLCNNDFTWIFFIIIKALKVRKNNFLSDCAVAYNNS